MSVEQRADELRGVAALIVYLVHAPLDWDWQMPAVTLVALVLAGMLLTLAGTPDQTEAAGAVEPPRSLAVAGR